MILPVLTILCGALCFGAFLVRILLKARYKGFLVWALPLATGVLFAAFLALLVLWGRRIYAENDLTKATLGFLFLGLTFGALVAAPFVYPYKIANTIDMILFLGFAIATVITFVFLSKTILQPDAVSSTSSALFLLF